MWRDVLLHPWMRPRSRGFLIVSVGGGSRCWSSRAIFLTTAVGAKSASRFDHAAQMSSFSDVRVQRSTCRTFRTAHVPDRVPLCPRRAGSSNGPQAHRTVGNVKPPISPGTPASLYKFSNFNARFVQFPANLSHLLSTSFYIALTTHSGRRLGAHHYPVGTSSEHTVAFLRSLTSIKIPSNALSNLRSTNRT